MSSSVRSPGLPTSEARERCLSPPMRAPYSTMRVDWFPLVTAWPCAFVLGLFVNPAANSNTGARL